MVYESAVDRAIREAAERGAFDNLPELRTEQAGRAPVAPAAPLAPPPAPAPWWRRRT